MRDIIRQRFNPNVEGFTPQAWAEVDRAVSEGMVIPLSYGFDSLTLQRPTGTGRLIEPTGRTLNFKAKTNGVSAS